MEKDFETFYQTRLRPSVGALKLQNDEAEKWKVAGFACVLFALGSVFLDQPYIGILFILIVIFSVYKYTKNKDAFIDSYKEKIINEIIQFIHPGLIYKPGNYVSSREYRASGLHRYIYDYYNGDDYVEGIYKGVKFHCSELETLIERRKRYSASTSQYVKGSIIFQGLFFVAVINQFRGGTYIWTQGDEQLPTSIMDEHYRLLPLPHVYKVKAANAEFEKYFSVYSTYPSEAQIILDDEMIQKMVNFRKQINRKVQFSIVAGKFYVSIPIEEDLLEPSGDLDDKESIKKYFFSILLILSIINQLRLNRFT